MSIEFQGILNTESNIDYESGRREFPIDCIIKLANFYNTSTDYLLGITNEKKPYPRIK